MPHPRQRLALSRLKKKLGFFPVIAIQGARQTGKSFLAREFLHEIGSKAKYVTLDQLSTRQAAERSPQTFIAEHSDASLLVIDEAQKAPDLFDAIKFEVDQKRVPGRFLLLGSTEFSRLSKIREALTGRMGRIRLYPLTIAEAIGLEEVESSPIKRKQVLNYLATGGMPGIFAVRAPQERDDLFQDWIDLTCQRDIHQFDKLKLDSDLALAILKETCVLDEPTQASIARRLRKDPRKIQTHLRALSELFVIQKLNPHPSGTGKPIYLPFDVGIAAHLGAPLMRRLHIWLMNERMAASSYGRGKTKTFYYYRSPGKKMIHLVEESIDSPMKAFQVFDNERILRTDALLMKAFIQKNTLAKGFVYAPIAEKQKVEGCTFLPWEEL